MTKTNTQPKTKKTTPPQHDKALIPSVWKCMRRLLYVWAMLFLEVAWPPTFPRTDHPERHKARHGKFVMSVGDADRDTSFTTPARGLLTTRQDSTRLMPEGGVGRKCRKPRVMKGQNGGKSNEGVEKAGMNETRHRKGKKGEKAQFKNI